MKKKRAWNMTNPLYRYLHGGGKKNAASTRRVRHMAKHKARSRRGGMGNMVPLLKKAAAGAGAAYVVGGGIPGYLAGFLAGGIPGVAGAFIAPKAQSIVAPTVQGTLGGLTQSATAAGSSSGW